MLHRLQAIKSREVFPGFHGRFIHSDQMTFAYWEIKKGRSLPEHAHMHEQVANILEGEFELTLDGTPFVLKPGSVLPIPSNVKHKGRALTDCKILDVFYPVREDYKS
jgi:quercetin dioxygenase-like cupin family protein